MDSPGEILLAAFVLAAAVSLVVLTFRVARRKAKTITRVGKDTAAVWAGECGIPDLGGPSEGTSDASGSDGGGSGD